MKAVRGAFNTTPLHFAHHTVGSCEGNMPAIPGQSNPSQTETRRLREKPALVKKPGTGSLRPPAVL